jgi:hypothetical protein
MPDRTQIEEILRSLSPIERRSALEDAGVRRDIHRDSERQGFLLQLNPTEVRALALPLLRRRRLSNDQFRAVSQEAHIDLWGTGTPEVRIKFPIGSVQSPSRNVPIPELALTSFIVWELSARIGQVLGAVGVSDKLEPPTAEVSAGTMNYSFGGGPLIVAGLGFMVAAHTLIPLSMAADISFFGGAILTVLGLPDLLLRLGQDASRDISDSRTGST